MISAIISRLVILVFGTLYPAYASYKAVRTKNLKEYVKWMMYWIVFALFTCTETFTDMFLSWFPFYYEVKIVLVLWLLSPATRGSSILYRKFVHPALCRREQEIDEYIAKAKDQGYHTVLNLGTKGVNYATTVIMQTAIKGGGGIVQQLRKSYSLSDLSECEPRDDRSQDEADDVLAEPRLIRRNVARSGYNTRRSASESNSRSPMYFPEVDVDVKTARTRSIEPDLSHIKSSEDISSGYSSADNSIAQQLSRTGSVGARSRGRLSSRTAVTSIKRPQAAEDNEVFTEELHEDDNFEFSNMPPLLDIPFSSLFLSHTNPPFIYRCIGDQIKIIQILGNVDSKNGVQLGDEDIVAKIEVDTNGNVSPVTEVMHVTKDILPENNFDEIKDIESNKDLSNNDVLHNESTTLAQSTEKPEPNCSTNDKCELINESGENIKFNETVDCSSIDGVSLNETYSAESDDEASFGTPDNSPKSKRKSPRPGKYGKGKAPPPPIIGIQTKTLITAEINETSNETVNYANNFFVETSYSKRTLQISNPITEKKKRHKSKSPARVGKSGSSAIGKLLQLPGKLAFWHKNDDRSNSSDNSRRSSTAERAADDFQSCIDLDAVINDSNEPNVNANIKNTDTEIYLNDSELKAESISQEVLDKSEELQKLITATLQSHPEYNYLPLHVDDERANNSKSTDV